MWKIIMRNGNPNKFSWWLFPYTFYNYKRVENVIIKLSEANITSFVVKEATLKDKGLPTIYGCRECEEAYWIYEGCPIN